MYFIYLSPQWGPKTVYLTLVSFILFSPNSCKVCEAENVHLAQGHIASFRGSVGT